MSENKKNTQSFEKQKKTYKFFYWLLAGAARKLYRVKVINPNNEPLDTHFIVAEAYGEADGIVINTYPYDKDNDYTIIKGDKLFDNYSLDSLSEYPTGF